MKNSTFLKGLLSLVIAFSTSSLLAQPPRTSTLNITAPQIVLTGSSLNFTATRNGNSSNWTGGNSNFTYTWSSVPAGVTFSVNNAVTSDNNSSTVASFPTAGGPYLITCYISEGGTGGGNATSAATSVTVVAAPTDANLWATSSDGTRVSGFKVNGAAQVAAPVNIFTPTYGSSGATSTAALGRNTDNGNPAEGYFYWLPNVGTGGVVYVFGATKNGGSPTLIGTLDVNGGLTGSLGFVRLGFAGDGTGYILASGDGILYLAKFKPNGVTVNSSLPAADQLTVLDASVAVSGGTVGTFQNGDICVSGNGTIIALANNAGTTQIFTGLPNGTSTTLTKKFDVKNQNGADFSGSVNGVAFDNAGSLYVSTSDGLYYIDQNTVNGLGGTINITQVWAGSGLQDLASNFFPETIITPVKLINFGGSIRNGATLLNWETTNEDNFSHFEIERSSTGNSASFATIGNKGATGGGSAKASYQHNDNLSSAAGTTFWYRLKMVDLDGKYKYSNVIMVRKDEKAITGITLSPNPVRADGIATIRVTAQAQAVISIRVVDLSGRVVLQQSNRVFEGNNSLQLTNADRLQPGNYVAQMVNGNEITSVKFTVVR